MAFYVAGLLGASGPIIVALGTLTAALGAISWPVVLGVAAFAGAATAIIKNWDSVVEYFTSGEGQKIWSTVKDTMSSFVNAVSAFWETFGSNIVSIVKGTFTTVVNLVGAGLEGLSVVLDVWSGKWLTNWDQFLEDTESSFSDTFGSGGYLESIAQSWWQRFLQNDPIVNAGNWISTVLGLDGPMQQASNEAPKESQKTAQYISSVYKNLSDKLKSIDFSFSTSDVGGSSQIKKQFKDIEQASLDLGISLSNNLAGGIEDMKASLPSALQGLSATEIALEKTKEQAQVMGQALQSTVTNAISSFATTLGNVFTGDAGAKGFFNNILTIVADFANKFGKLLIGAGSAALAFKNLLANPIAAIAAGAALIVASTAVKNLLKKGPSTSVNDALVRSDGSVVKFNKADSLLAMKDFGGLATAMGNAQPRQSRPMISEGRLAGAIGKELDKRLQRLGDNEIFAMAQRGRRSY